MREYRVWSETEEQALRLGVTKHGTGAWEVIRCDVQFREVLRRRTGVQLKDKWRNLVKFQHLTPAELQSCKTNGHKRKPRRPLARAPGTSHPLARKRPPSNSTGKQTGTASRAQNDKLEQVVAKVLAFHETLEAKVQNAEHAVNVKLMGHPPGGAGGVGVSASSFVRPETPVEGSDDTGREAAVATLQAAEQELENVQQDERATAAILAAARECLSTGEQFVLSTELLRACPAGLLQVLRGTIPDCIPHAELLGAAAATGTREVLEPATSASQQRGRCKLVADSSSGNGFEFSAAVEVAGYAGSQAAGVINGPIPAAGHTPDKPSLASWPPPRGRGTPRQGAVSKLRAAGTQGARGPRSPPTDPSPVLHALRPLDGAGAALKLGSAWNSSTLSLCSKYDGPCAAHVGHVGAGGVEDGGGLTARDHDGDSDMSAGFCTMEAMDDDILGELKRQSYVGDWEHTDRALRALTEFENGGLSHGGHAAPAVSMPAGVPNASAVEQAAMASAARAMPCLMQLGARAGLEGEPEEGCSWLKDSSSRNASPTHGTVPTLMLRPGEPFEAVVKAAVAPAMHVAPGVPDALPLDAVGLGERAPLRQREMRGSWPQLPPSATWADVAGQVRLARHSLPAGTGWAPMLGDARGGGGAMAALAASLSMDCNGVVTGEAAHLLGIAAAPRWSGSGSSGSSTCGLVVSGLDGPRLSAGVWSARTSIAGTGLEGVDGGVSDVVPGLLASQLSELDARLAAAAAAGGVDGMAAGPRGPGMF